MAKTKNRSKRKPEGRQQKRRMVKKGDHLIDLTSNCFCVVIKVQGATVKVWSEENGKHLNESTGSRCPEIYYQRMRNLRYATKEETQKYIKEQNAY